MVYRVSLGVVCCMKHTIIINSPLKCAWYLDYILLHLFTSVSCHAFHCSRRWCLLRDIHSYHNLNNDINFDSSISRWMLGVHIYPICVEIGFTVSIFLRSRYLIGERNCSGIEGGWEMFGSIMDFWWFFFLGFNLYGCH